MNVKYNYSTHKVIYMHFCQYFIGLVNHLLTQNSKFYTQDRDVGMLLIQQETVVTDFDYL